ncbi:MurR/RpiR family transcriptional regulator [Serratia entomophila]|uniref:MurR/RpiR family transcriptional regulator n=1 Tax=Serratia entomophila TaxID=42906 RepID=UPI00217B3375|nr:MurR/RpiR family transcriptional regulator [Serratia entomophila]CAI1161814.1 DNA-binding transcriptional repressor RpiR [Serratia entomophila]CAI1787476.1 DNA-binding transcriptional repressor RpiR [Serratia entomophila]CAI1909640.1 DNA-binding transcriptional repressor RpiR [Serratia entomophila]CAI1911560.1 DNA-binding transcriptional repressor RpiR [Serratia entomophila]CAI1992129.1 DNA-binding transcriptional repressor RpiR [Serratia entomophila]
MPTANPRSKPTSENELQTKTAPSLRSEIEARMEGRRLTPAHRRIVQILVDHAADIGFLSSMELAQLANVSQPSVSRFAVALGYDGFLEMRKALRSIPEHSVSGAAEEQNKYQTAALAESANIAMLAADLSDDSVLRAFGVAMTESMPLAVLGLRASAGLATHFSYFAAKVHPDVRPILHGGSLAEDQLEQAHAAGATFLMAFVMPLYPRETIRLLQYAKQLGMKVGVVSDPAFVGQQDTYDLLLTARINSSLVFDTSASSIVLASALLDAMCDAMPKRAESRLEVSDRSSARRKVFIR